MNKCLDMNDLIKETVSTKKNKRVGIQHHTCYLMVFIVLLYWCTMCPLNNVQIMWLFVLNLFKIFQIVFSKMFVHRNNRNVNYLLIQNLYNY